MGKSTSYAKLLAVIIIAGIVVLGVNYVFFSKPATQSVINLGGGTGGGTGDGTGNQPPATGVQASFDACRVSGTTPTITTSLQNKGITTATQYTGTTAYVTKSNGQIFTSGTTNTGSTRSPVSINLGCSLEKLQGNLVIIGSSSTNSVMYPFALTNGATTADVSMENYNATALKMTIRNADTGANESLSTDTSNSANLSWTIDLTQNTPKNLRLQAKPTVTANGYFGAPVGSGGAGVLISIDNGDTSKFAKNDISLYVLSAPGGWGLTEITCPSNAVAYDSADRCYTAPPMTYTAEYTLGITMSPSLASPSASTTARVYLDDYQYYDNGGFPTVDVFDNAGTNLGVASQAFNITYT